MFLASTFKMPQVLPPAFVAKREAPREESREEDESSVSAWDLPCLAGFLQTCLDDMLFIGESRLGTNR